MTQPDVDGPPPSTLDDLRPALTDLVARADLLVASDLDGVLAAFRDDPLAVRPVPRSLAALRALAGHDDVHVAVVSGRDLGTLRTLTGIDPQERIVLVGSHGAEFSAHAVSRELDEDDARRLAALREDLEGVVAAHPPTRIEYKPASIGLHVRGLPTDVQEAALAAGAEAAGRHAGITVIPGKGVMEAGVLDADKGTALLALAGALGSQGVLYLGDDVTDERAFEALGSLPHSLTVKVGEGATAATHRVADTSEVADLLTLLSELVDSR